MELGLNNWIDFESKSSGKLELGRFTIPYRVHGNTGPLIVCVNGLVQTMSNWKSVADCLANDYRLLTFDFPGQLRATIRSGEDDVSLDEQVEILAQIVDIFSPDESVSLLSASWGGAPSLVYASQYVDRVESMIIGGFGAQTNQNILKIIKQGHKLLSQGDSHSAGNLLVKKLGLTLSGIHQSKIVRQFRKMRSTDLKILINHMEYFVSKSHITEIADVTKIRARTLLICGDVDPIVDTSSVFELQDYIPDCDIHIAKNVGHFLHFERPDLLDRYRNFFDECYRSIVRYSQSCLQTL